MTDLETPSFTCPQGHRWPINAPPTDRSGDERPRCPICGDAAEPVRLLFGGVREETSSELLPPTPSAAPPARSTVPAVPGYTILGVAGHGRAGVVYKARDLRGRLVALAVIATGLNGTSDEGSPSPVDFDVVRLRHPAIVPVFATGWHEGGRFLASEFVEGRSLAEFRAGEPLPILTTAQLIETLARAVHDAHQQGLYHGDLTPAQVLLTPSQPPRFVDPELGQLCDESGRELVPKVTGFGVNSRPGLDGTAGPPAAADVFALGSILFELLNGHPPRDVEARDREPTQPGAWNPKVPRDLEAICLACLEADPARRLAGAGLLADALRQFLDSFVTQFPCSRCNKVLKSTKPLRVGTTTVRCPRCGEQSLVKPVGGPAPTPSSPEPAERHTPARTPRPVPEPRRTPAPPASPAPGDPAASPRAQSPVTTAPGSLRPRSGPDPERRGRPDRGAVPLVPVIRPLADPPFHPLRLAPRGAAGGGGLCAPGRAGPGRDGRGLQGEAREAQAGGRLEDDPERPRR